MKRGDVVGIVEANDKPPDGFLRVSNSGYLPFTPLNMYVQVRLNNDVGLVPKKCFEIPAKGRAVDIQRYVCGTSACMLQRLMTLFKLNQEVLILVHFVTLP